MRATGIIRRIDDLGRIVIPRDIRRAMNIHEGDPLEIFTDDKDGSVIFKPYLPYIELWRSLDDLADVALDSEDYKPFAKEIRTLAKKMKDAQK